MEQNTPEWQEFRKKRIGASDVPIIMGVSPWSDPLTLWRQKMDIVDTTFETAAMTHGRDNEGIARDKFNAMMGFNFQPEVVTHPTKP